MKYAITVTQLLKEFPKILYVCDLLSLWSFIGHLRISVHAAVCQEHVLICGSGSGSYRAFLVLIGLFVSKTEAVSV